MTEKKIVMIHRIYGICMSILSVALAVLCIVLCLNIYHSGEEPFTRQRIGESFSYIAALVYIYIAAAIGGVVLNRAMPKPTKRLNGTVNEGNILYRLSAKSSSFSKEALDKIDKQRAIRLIMIIISFVLVIGAAISAFILVPSEIDANSESTNNEVLLGWLSTLRYFVIPFAQLIITAYVCKRSVQKELAIVKEEIKNKKRNNENTESKGELGTFTKLTNELNSTVSKVTSPKKWHKPLSLAITCAIFCLAVAFIVVGIVNDGQVDVVSKACQICRECIGMG